MPVAMVSFHSSALVLGLGDRPRASINSRKVLIFDFDVWEKRRR